MGIIKELQRKIKKADYEYYFSYRVEEGGVIYEKRYYYFTDLAQLYHDKKEKHFFLKALDPLENEQDCLKIPKGIVPIYLDIIDYDSNSKVVTILGYDKSVINQLLDTFWSEDCENLSDEEGVVVKDFSSTKFLDILEEVKDNQPFYIK